MSRTMLLIEDEAPVADLVVREFEANGWTVRLAREGRVGLTLLHEPLPDIVVLDVGLPDLTGFEVCRAIRTTPATADLPVIFLTAHNEEIDRVVGLEIGADDYVGKPFSVRELMARVHAVLRRARHAASLRAASGGAVPAAGEPGGAAVTCGALTIDERSRIVRIGQMTVPLRAREFDLLLTLARSPGQVHRRADLLRSLWGYERPSEVLTRTVDVHVRRLRQKLGAEGDRIETVKGVGYRWSDRADAGA